MREEGLTRRLAAAAAAQFVRQFSENRVDDAALRADLRRIVAPWVRARRAEGHDLEAMHDVMQADQLLLRRGARVLAKHYPRLMARQVADVVRAAAERGELIADETGRD